ncbi:ABC transporter ATP-binding protein [Novosphingobium sp. Chol11]|uniref:ABC transporter ATP-binding protein n=1 Tax=Novosphingobium sp. Chol11 TaxID=1385763 RepID=UPI002601581E|nr:ABC transporter ATP-binding protein [Novosphingobium sp. Chol11]
MMGLRFDHLSLALRGRQVLRDVSGHFPPASVTVILGANGAGKSTLLACLAALRTTDSGEVTLDGKPLLAIPPMERARQIGLLPQQADIHWDINVRALVALGRLPHHGRWGRRAADEAAIDEAMAQTDCARFAQRKAQRLSGGEQARVLLARVLAGKPDWVLADEPLANLDPAHQLDAMACFRAAASAGAGVALVLHDLTQAARIADHLIVMKEGGIIASGPKAQVLTPAVLEAAYGVRVYIGQDETGAPVIAPVSRVA